MEKEIWKDIPEFEGFYQVSNLGNVKSLDREIITYIGNNSYIRKYKGRILTPRIGDRGGHKVVTLRKPNVRKAPYVHKLVAEIFLGPRPKEKVICHNDGNPNNNAVFNLRYDTIRNNNMDVYRHNRKMGRNTLDLEKVYKIKSLLKERVLTQREIAKKFQVSYKCISNINTGKTYDWLDSL